MAKLGLTLNEAKTSLIDARRESFDFLGYTVSPQRYGKDGHWYLGASPSRKSVQRIKTKIGDLLASSNKEKDRAGQLTFKTPIMCQTHMTKFGAGRPARVSAINSNPLRNSSRDFVLPPRLMRMA